MLAFRQVDVTGYAARAGVALEDLRRATLAVAEAGGAAFFEDLGVQMNHHSTLVSYLEKLLWSLCGHFGNPGGQYTVASLQHLGGSGWAMAGAVVTIGHDGKPDITRGLVRPEDMPKKQGR